MPLSDCLRIAKRLRTGRVFDGKKIKRNLPSIGDQYEKKLALRYKNPKEFRKVMNEILDNLEGRSFEDDLDLEISYYDEIGKYARFGLMYEYRKAVWVD